LLATRASTFYSFYNYHRQWGFVLVVALRQPGLLRRCRAIEEAQMRIAQSNVKVAFGTDCGMFPFSEGILEFQAMVAAGLTPTRALKAGTSVAAELLQREDLGIIAPGNRPTLLLCRGIHSRILP
jgi:imidazolonepropionase-like amidohydrolase